MYGFDTLPEHLQEQIIEQALKQYSERVVDHWLNPRGFGRLENPGGRAIQNGLCGEAMEISIRVKDGKIVEARFLTDGCITSTASGSMATELATGKTISKATAISKDDILEGLGGLPEESQHCALLAANTLRAAIVDFRLTRKEPWKKMYQPG